VTVPSRLWWSYSELWWTWLHHWINCWFVTNNIRSIMTALHHRSPHGTFSIRHVPIGPSVTHPWRLQFVIKVSARSFLHTTCTCGTLSPSDMWYLNLWGLSPCPSDLWDLTACMSLVLVDPSPSKSWDPTVCVSRVPMGPSDLWDPTTYISCVPMGPFSISIRPVWPDGLRVTCCHYGLINSNSKETMRPESRTRGPE
jgi:hypothetical protein